MKEATEFTVKVVAYAIVCDHTCGVINLVQITESGSRRRTIKPVAHPVDNRTAKT
jgi:hypothetical protein